MKELAIRHGSQRGSIVVAGQRVALDRPRARSKQGEAALSCYALMRHSEAMPQAAVKRMVRGVSTRNHGEVIEAATEGYGIKKSSVSRNFIQASERSLNELREQRFDGVRFVSILIDGKEYSGMQLVVLLG